MLVQICSDLHLEFAQNRDWIRAHPLVPKAEILLIAGDTYYINEKLNTLDFIKRVSDQFKAVYLVPGNHEYYDGFDTATAIGTMFESITSNVFLVNNYTTQIDDVQFVFSTLWSTIQKNILAIMNGMTDFRRIQFENERFTVHHFNQLHEACFEFIKEAVNRNGKKIVVTHHLPSVLCNAEEFKNSLLNDAFCVEKTNFILNSTIDYWVYGHSHRNLNDFKIGTTQMVTNQLGYVGKNEHTTFSLEKVIEI